jgi:hypothetical protein
VGFWLVLVFSVAVITAAVKQRFEDGPNRVFSGGALIQGALYQGPEPDWSFVNEIATIELQLLQPEQSRRIWVASVSGRLFVWSGYMNSFMGKLWKQWPLQAERDNRAVVRIDGKRYERQLVRVREGGVLDDLTAIINEKYPSRTSRAAVESGFMSWHQDQSRPRWYKEQDHEAAECSRVRGHCLYQRYGLVRSGH